MDKTKTIDLSHHKKQEYCTSRLKYRDGKKLTAVKVYTIVNESKYLLVFGVPRINLHQEIKRLFMKYGQVSESRKITDQLITNESVEIEQFTDCYYLKFGEVHEARLAKARIDRKNFYGGILHISYAPEYETVADLREKFNFRRRDVQNRLRKLKSSAALQNTNTLQQYKRSLHVSDDEPLAKQTRL